MEDDVSSSVPSGQGPQGTGGTGGTDPEGPEVGILTQNIPK